MINDGVNDIPDNSIVIFRTSTNLDIDDNRISSLITQPPKRRDWFLPYFYKCLPLTIGNQYGYAICCEFGFSVTWDGTSSVDGISFEINAPAEESDNYFPRVHSHFGAGVITIEMPFTLRTPKGVNLVTINPPNVVLPNITVMTGVVEADNLRAGFTFNLKIQQPGIKVYIPPMYPLAAVVPVPRYYVDSFQLVFAEDIFTKQVIDEEVTARMVSSSKRAARTGTEYPYDDDYMSGRDTYGNVFLDHQTSVKKTRTTNKNEK